MRILNPLALPLMAVVATLTGGALMAENRIDLIRPDAPDLAAFGMHAVGVTTRELVNPRQIDIVNSTDTTAPLYDRPLTVEIWYPAVDGTVPGGTYQALMRDGLTEVTLTGRATRDAAPLGGETYPLVILSHGYPGNRFLLSHLGENLASKGYVVVSIDHTDSTYDTQAAFGSTLVNRPWDQSFVLDAMDSLDGPLGAVIDASQTAVVGYSMGGYGALIFAGAGVTEAAPSFSYAPPQRLLERNMAGSATHADLVDERVRAVVAFAPWGRNTDFWDAAGLAGIEKPLMLVAGSVDDVSGYESIRSIFAETTGTTRHLLTFDNANHNAGAPMPAPMESWQAVPTLDFVPFDHYADPVWDTVRMNNVSAHFLTAFLDLHLKGEREKAAYLDLLPVAAEGVVALDEDGQPTPEHSYWRGFDPRTAVGLRFETLMRGQ
jgi:predicted dienelactone hydrolase